MVERITSRRSTLRTLPALREQALPRPRAQRMCCGVHTESSADRSEMGKIDRSRRRRGCAGALRHKICTASLDNRPLIDGFVFLLDSALVRPKFLFRTFGRGVTEQKNRSASSRFLGKLSWFLRSRQGKEADPWNLPILSSPCYRTSLRFSRPRPTRHSW